MGYEGVLPLSRETWGYEGVVPLSRETWGMRVLYL